jgi:hypothetical protein
VQALSGSEFVFANNAFLSSTNAFSVATQTNTVWLNNAYVAGTRPAGTSWPRAIYIGVMMRSDSPFKISTS